MEPALGNNSPIFLNLDTQSVHHALQYGYISRSFGEERAGEYFRALLKLSQADWESLLHPFNRPGTYNNGGPQPNTIIFFSVAGQIIDFDIRRHSGDVVLQSIWSPISELNRIRYVTNTPLEMPVYLMHSTWGIGVSVTDALAGNYRTLRGLYDPVRMGGRSTAVIRICANGIPEYKKQIHIRDHTASRAVITTDNLVRKLGKLVEQFVVEYHLQPTPLTLESTIMIGIIQVSSGCWMLLLRRDSIL